MMPHSARNASVNFLFSLKCPRINANQLIIFAHTVATQIPAMAAKLWTQHLKPLACTLPTIAPHPPCPQASVSAAFISKARLNFASIANTCLHCSGTSRQMIGIQHTITARTADHPALFPRDRRNPSPVHAIACGSPCAPLQIFPLL